MSNPIILITTVLVFVFSSGACRADQNVPQMTGENNWGQLAGAPAEVQEAGQVVKKWFEAYLADDVELAGRMYHTSRRGQGRRDLEQLNKLLEVVGGWRFQPMVVMVGGREAKVISCRMGVSDSSVLIVHLKKDGGEWQILYWSADALRNIPEFYPQFHRKYPDALIWLDETIEDWLRPLQKTKIDIYIGELFSLPSGEKSVETLHKKLRGVRGEQATFESYFPDSVRGGKILDSWWKADDKESYSDNEILTIIRNGFRRSPDGSQRRNREKLIRWVSQHYIWGKETKDKKAVQWMYYASFDPDINLVASVVYFGLSVAGDQQDERVLKRLVDICMSDINTGRILWGTQGKRDRMLDYLKPYLDDSDGEICARAVIVQKALKGEIDYEQWEREQFKKERRELFGDKMGIVREVLLKGSNLQRREVFRQIRRQGLRVLFDDTFVEPLKACLEDSDPVVKEMALVLGGELLRKEGETGPAMLQLMTELSKEADRNLREATAVFVGTCWIWGVEPQSAEAIEIMLRLSKDKDYQVRNAAVYYGLSVIADKSDEVIKRLVDKIAELDGREDLGRIIWGLRRGTDKEKVRVHLQPFISLRNPKGERARKAYFEIFKEELQTEAVIVPDPF